MSTVGGTRSTFGVQSRGQWRSSPVYGFGSGTRDQQDKVFVSHEHSKLVGNPCSPGPAVYTKQAAVGPQTDGSKASAPVWAFGTAGRWTGNSKDSAPGPGQYDATRGVGTQVSSAKTSAPIYGFGSSTRAHVEKVFVTEEHNKALFGINSPGPATYAHKGAVGPQTLSNNGSQPGWVMGKAERFSYDHVKRAAAAPGPGAYAMTPAVGQQYSSTKPSTPRFGFGTSDRDMAAKVYISSEHEKSSGGRDVPGPGTYPVKQMTGSQNASSKQHTSAAWGFGTSERFSTKKGYSSAPGPGQYIV